MKSKLMVAVVAVLGVLIVAGWMRLYDIQNFPAGLFPDEAANGEDALLILEGDTRPFYPRGNGREGLYFYLEAAAVAALGIGVWQLHLVSALIGIATVAAIYFATQVFFGRLAGVLAAFFLATSYWHVTLSRTGFRAILIPLFVAAFTAFVGYTIRAVKEKRQVASYVYAALAGAAFMGGFYTYIAYRVMVGVVLGIMFLLLLAAAHPKIGFPHVKRYGKQTLVAILAGLIVFAPLGWYFIQNPADFVGRAGQVSVFNKELQAEYGGGTLLGTIIFSTRETLLSFFYGEGDLNWRHNVSGSPLLDPLVGLLFLLGFMWVIQGTVMVFVNVVRGKEIHMGMVYPYLLLLLAGMLLPVITTAEGIPHGLRSIGLIVPIFMLAGTAGAVVIHWVERKVRAGAVRAICLGLVYGAVLVSGLYSGALYMLVSRNDSGAYYAYRSDLTDVSEYIVRYVREHPDAARPYLVLDKFSVQTVHFLTHSINSGQAHTIENGEISPPPHDFQEHPDKDQHRYEMLDPASAEATKVQAGEVIIFTMSTFPDAERYEREHGDNIELVESRQNRFGQEIMRVYRGRGPGGGEVLGDFNLDAEQ